MPLPFFHRLRQRIHTVMLIRHYWPAVVAGLYLLYLISAGRTDEIPAAVTAFLAAAGLSHSAAAAHAKIEAMQ
jgi:hypothetical protein